MYLPKHFEEKNFSEMLSLMKASPLTTLVIFSEGKLVANHIPMLWEAGEADEEGLGHLTAHIPRSNSLSKLVSEVEALAIFHGPDSYITPNWYPTKKAHGKVVPTWNYQVVHAHGVMRVIDDASWVHGQISRLTEQSEASRGKDWQVSDAPDDYVGNLLKALVGLELNIQNLIGKTKASQNQPVENQEGVVSGLSQSHLQKDLDMSAIVAKKAAKIQN
ncbi:MAG: FMN-binding negative transcriptional regulator [Deinococcales bacterium]